MEEKEHNNFEYDPEVDKLSSNVIAIIIVVSILAAIYLSFVVV